MLNPRNTNAANSGGFDMLGLPYYEAFDIRLWQIPTIVPCMPEGGSGAIH